jgi:hypothetical protein
LGAIYQLSQIKATRLVSACLLSDRVPYLHVQRKAAFGGGSATSVSGFAGRRLSWQGVFLHVSDIGAERNIALVG